MFESVLVANRGEIAVRVMRTLAALGVRAIAVHSDLDVDAPHVRAADEALRIESYLDISSIISAARESGAEAIHPGYGFLSENPAFARACAEAGRVFIGPPPEAMELLGDKARAKAVAEQAGVPVLPGLNREDLSDEQIVEWADEFPLMVKAAAGGGGRGMRVVQSRTGLPEALQAARREAKAAFGSDALLVERYVPRARHIEVQVLADTHGTVLALGERECSLQRRHQKLVEESPSSIIDDRLRGRLGEAAVALARDAGYVGAGTVEFIVPYEDPEAFAFLEVNARLQVEHPVTELVTGLDLVEQQLRIAAGERLALEPVLRGHAIEVRVCAEDASFLPSTGLVAVYREPSGIRVDSGIAQGSVISSAYDSLLLKLIAHGADREQALERLARGLRGLRILGVTTNAGYLERLLNTPEVRAGELDTGLLERRADTPPDGTEAAIAMAVAESLDARGEDPWDTLRGRRVTGDEPVEYDFDDLVVRLRGDTVWVECEQRFSAADRDGVLRLTLDGRTRLWHHATVDGERWVSAGADAFHHRLAEPVVEGAAAPAGGALEAPMPGSVLSVKVSPGDEVSEGDVLVIVESMKMELSLTAPHDATVVAIDVNEGDQVKQGQALVELEAV